MSLFSSFARVVGDGLAAIAGIHTFPTPRQSHASAALSIQELGDGPPRTMHDIAKVQFLLSSPYSPLRQAAREAPPRIGDDDHDDEEATAAERQLRGGRPCLPALPPEIVSLILDFAEYYICRVSFHFAPTTFTDDADELYFRTPPLNGVLERGFLRKVEFRIVSHDQGFSGEPVHMHGTKEGSWTWWEATLDRPAPAMPLAPQQERGGDDDDESHTREGGDVEADKDQGYATARSTPVYEASSTTLLLPFATTATVGGSRRSSSTASPSVSTTASRRPSSTTTGSSSPSSEMPPKPVYVEQARYELTRNLHAIRRFTEHTVTFNADHALVVQARRGDSIGIWARSRFPAWKNVVKEVEVKMWLAS